MWIGVYLPHLSREVFQPNWSSTSDAGLVVLDHERVVALDQAAHEAGVRMGMRKGGVLTLAPDARIHDKDELKEQQAVADVATALMQFCPQVSIAEEQTVLVDVSASLRLFGGVRALRRAIRASLAAFGFTVRISDEGDRPFRDRDRRFRQRDRPFRERDRTDRTTGLALRMTSTTRAMLAGFCRREHARAPDEHAHDQGRFTT